MDAFPRKVYLRIVRTVITVKIRESIKKINIQGTIKFLEPLSKHCTFRVGGPADIMAWPQNAMELQTLLSWAKNEGIPTLLLGGGANVVPSDHGFRGLVISTTAINTWTLSGSKLQAGAGCIISDLAGYAADRGQGGLDFIFAMPGTLGGAAYMNARCYDGEISQVIKQVDYLDSTGTLVQRELGPGDFSYKISPFTNTDWIICSVIMELQPGDPGALWERMRGLETDRRVKGHFDAPCAGSVFKNDRNLGAPTGKVLDGLGVRGMRIGGAVVSPKHANIILNDQQAKARDIRDLTEGLMLKAKQELGVSLEPEILFIGDWVDQA